MRRNVEKEAVSNLLKPNEFYLLGYNSFQAMGWTYIAYLSVTHLLVPDENENFFERVILSLAVFQTLALLEVVHAMIGLVRSSPIITAFQVASRLFLVWGVSLLSYQAQIGLGFKLMLAAWTITEIIRYSFYCTSIMDISPKFLTYLRYTLFIGLYPMGVTGELLCIYRLAISPMECSVFDYHLPNPFNLHFDYYYFLHLVILAYLFIFPQMYGHMKRQRRKVLGTPVHAKSE